MNARRFALTPILVAATLLSTGIAATADAAWRDWVPFAKKSQSRTSMLDDKPVVSAARNAKKPRLIERMGGGSRRMWRSTKNLFSFRRREVDRGPISGETRRIRGRMPQEEEDRRGFSWFRKKPAPEPESVDPLRDWIGGDRPGF